MGREREISLLENALSDALSGRARCVLLAGDPGIGKTTLAEHVAARATESGARVYWGPSWEGAGTPAYWPWIQIVRAAVRDRPTADLLDDLGEGAADVARLVPDVGRRFLSLEAASETDAERARFRLFDSVARLIRSAAASAPVVLILDDLHWSDHSSLMLLRFAAGALRDAPVLILGTYRDLEVDAAEALADVTRDVIRLTGLSDDDVAVLIHSTTGAEPPRDLSEAVRTRTGGNPFFVKEVAHLLAAQGRLGDGASAAIPEGVREAVQRRIARLPQDCADILVAAAALGPEFDVDLLAEVTNSPAADVARVLQDACSARLVERLEHVPERFAFAHALVRESIYEATDREQRARLHLRAAEVLETRYATASGEHLTEIANHFVKAGAAGDPCKAADVATRAARRAMTTYAWEEAGDLFARAVEMLGLAGADDPVLVRTMLELADAKVRTGDAQAARIVYERAAELAEGMGLAMELAHAALGVGGGLVPSEVPAADPRQLELLDHALKLLPREDSPVRAWVLARSAIASRHLHGPEERADRSRQAVAMARRLGDRRALSYALASLCDTVADPASLDERLAAAEEIVRLAAQSDPGSACGVTSCRVCVCDPEFMLLGLRARLAAQLEAGDAGSTDEDLEVYATLAQHLREPAHLWRARSLHAMRAIMRGAFEDAAQLVAEAADAGAGASSGPAARITTLQRSRLARERGTPAAAAAVPPDGSLATLVVRAQTAVAAGERGSAMELYQALLPFEHLCVVEADGAYFGGAVAHHLGRLAALAGRLDAAAGHLEAALATHGRVGATAWTARSQLEYARILPATGDARAELRHTLLRAAAATFEGLGLPEAAIAQALLETGPTEENVFRREGDFWTAAFGGVVARLKDSKGIRDIAVLLQRPGEEVAALDLAGAGADVRAAGGHAGEVLDAGARAAYKARIVDLQRELDDADGDPVRAEKARAELEWLTSQLAGAYGLGGRARRAADPAERARKAVTERIKDTIGKLQNQHQPLYRHLSASIRTGTFCSYVPERPVTWTF